MILKIKNVRKVINMNFKQVRIVWDENNTLVKEVLREFLYFIGIAVCELPVKNIEKSIYDIKAIDRKTLDIFIKNSNTFSTQSVEIKNEKIILNIDPDSKLSNNLISELFKKLIDGLIDNYEISAQLQEIRKIFFDENLFLLFQAKHSFQICYLKEVSLHDRFETSIKMNLNDDSYCANYVNHMVEVFKKVYYELEIIYNPSVYTLYARLNIARKIGEIATDTINGKFDLKEFDFNNMINQINNLYALDKTYLTTFFLAYATCKTYAGHYLSCTNYMRGLFDAIENYNNPCYENFFFEYGRHCLRVYSDYDNLYSWYKERLGFDSLNYQALYDFASINVKMYNYKEAQELIEKVIEIISLNYSRKYENLSYKELLYLYRCNFMLYTLNKHRDHNLTAEWHHEAAEQIAYNYIECSNLKKLCDSDNQELEKLLNFLTPYDGPARLLVDNFYT